MHPIWFSTLCLSLLILTGCGAAPTPAQIPTEPGPETVLRVLPSPAETIAPPPPTVNPSEPSPGLEALILGAKADLAGRLALKVEQITLVTWAAVTWPDTSLGCPQADSLSSQVLTPGYLINLETGGEIYAYHTDQTTQIVFCGPADNLPILEIPITPGTIQDGKPWMPID
jgi:hypothetical protein